MKLKELRKIIDGYPKDMDEHIVVCACDGYSPLSEVGQNSVYIAESTWSGEVYDTTWTADEACMEDDQWEEFKNNSPKCIVLHPIN